MKKFDVRGNVYRTNVILIYDVESKFKSHNVTFLLYVTKLFYIRHVINDRYVRKQSNDSFALIIFSLIKETSDIQVLIVIS